MDNELITANDRVINSRNRLPGMRAVLGGLLVGLASLGTFLIAANYNTPETITLTIAKRDIPIGTQISNQDISLENFPKSDKISKRGFASNSIVVGATTLAPLMQGDIIQPSSIAKRESITGEYEISFSIASSRALDGTLLQGEYVDVISTSKQPQQTLEVVKDARVIRSSSDGSALGKSSDITLTLALTDTNAVIALTSAVDTGQITIVRTPVLNTETAR